MPKAKPLPPQELLLKLLRYESETGKLFWRERPREMFSSDPQWRRWNTRYAEKEAFTAIDKIGGYRFGNIYNSSYKAHRIVWKMVFDEDPYEIDHIDGCPFNNDLTNLRNVDPVQNSRNKAIRKDRPKGRRVGVSWNSRQKKWHSHIGVRGKRLHLGWYDHKVDAIAARKAAEVKYGFHPNHGRLPISQQSRR